MTNEELSFEPTEYFKNLKSKLSIVDNDKLAKNKRVLANEIEKAKSLGQKNYLHKAAFMWTVLEREICLNAVGVEKYVLREDVVKFIDNVKPKNSVKIVELENYPRSIPDENMKEIKRLQDLNLFDTIVIVYTDFADEEVHTPEQKEYINRNKDPIAFGMFMDEQLAVQHDRMYLITDWEDEYCHLTFTKLIDEMGKMGIKNPEKTTEPNIENINDTVNEALTELKEFKIKKFNDHAYTKKTFWQKLKELFR